MGGIGRICYSCLWGYSINLGGYMNINKDEDILVIIKNEEKFYWFVAFKEMWVLDRVKWSSDFIRNEIDGFNPNIHQERYYIPVINKENVDGFIQSLTNDGYLYNKNDMADEFYKRLSVKTVWWDIYDLMPDLFIDFDSNRLYSEYVENMHYEKYVPKGWFGELVDFCDNSLLQKCEMFWVKNGVDYRREILSKD